MKRNGYQIIWAFNIRPDAQKTFETLYGPEGAWVTLFRKGHGYRGTRLYQDRHDPLSYLVVDDWQSQVDYQAFKEHFVEEYNRLDTLCESLTETEQCLAQANELSCEWDR